MSFQENLRRCREAAGFTSARSFAEFVGISYPTYMGYENRGREPKYETLCRIADTLNVTTDKLLGHKQAEFIEEQNIINDMCQRLDIIAKIASKGKMRRNEQ